VAAARDAGGWDDATVVVMRHVASTIQPGHAGAHP
jgi:hypothetical protein